MVENVLQSKSHDVAKAVRRIPGRSQASEATRFLFVPADAVRFQKAVIWL